MDSTARSELAPAGIPAGSELRVFFLADFKAAKKASSILNLSAKSRKTVFLLVVSVWRTVTVSCGHV